MVLDWSAQLNLKPEIGGPKMHSKLTLAIMALSLGGCFILAAPSATLAQSGEQQHQKTGTDNRSKSVAPRKSAPRDAAPRKTGPRKTAPRETAPRKAAPLEAAPRKTAPREGAPREGAPRKTAPLEAAPRKTAPRKTAPLEAAPRKTAPPTGSARGLRSLPTRGASRTAIHGRNFTAWRSGYRARRGSGWRTFGALSALSAIVIGSSTYYPYAYISAAQPFCDGLTEDGCALMWQEVTTLEGDLAYQCVAYCPWQ